MAEEKKRIVRKRRTPEQRIKDIDTQIAKLQAEKAELEKPIKIRQILEKASDMSPEEIAEKLGIEL